MTIPFLLARAHRFPVQEHAQPCQDWQYCRAVGAWVSVAKPTAELMVQPYRSVVASRPGPRPQPPRPPMPSSKKADIETGEDMKGE